ncbi:MAG: methylenetetrahydrofolate reductase [Elusimicrobiota bacterium]
MKIPKKLLNILNEKLNNEDFYKKSVEFSINQILDLKKNGVDGIHFFTFNRASATKRILNSL